MLKKSHLPELALLAVLAVLGPAAAAAVDLEYFNVKTYGAVGNGIADDTAAINSALAAARTAGRGTVFFPAGTYNTSGNHDLSGTNAQGSLRGLRILGSGIGGTTLNITNPANNLFFSNTETVDLTLQDFSVTTIPPAVRTGGWVYQAGVPVTSSPSAPLRRSRIESIDVKKQVNGFWIAQYEFVWMKNLMMSDFVAGSGGVGGIGIQAGQTTAGCAACAGLTPCPYCNQGSELYILGTQVYANDFVGNDPRALAYGIWIEDTDAVYVVNSGVGAALTNGLVIKGNNNGHSPANHFFDQLISDATRDSHGFWITGGGTVLNLKFTGCWFASAGQASLNGNPGANGIRIDVSHLSGFVEITGSKIVNNKGTGLYLATHSTNAALAISGNTIQGNGGGGQLNNTDGIYVDEPINALGPVISGNQELGEAGVGLRTSPTANRLVIVGNRFVSGVSFGITPNVVGLNEGTP